MYTCCIHYPHTWYSRYVQNNTFIMRQAIQAKRGVTTPAKIQRKYTKTQTTLTPTCMHLQLLKKSKHTMPWSAHIDFRVLVWCAAITKPEGEKWWREERWPFAYLIQRPKSLKIKSDKFLSAGSKEVEILSWRSSGDLKVVCPWQLLPDNVMLKYASTFFATFGNCWKSINTCL